MAIPVDIFADNTYTGLQVCELLRRAVIMSNNLVEDHQSLKPVVQYSIMAKYVDTLEWILGAEADVEDARELLALSLMHRHKDVNEILDLWRESKAPTAGQGKGSYRERMKATDYRDRNNGGRTRKLM